MSDTKESLPAGRQLLPAGLGLLSALLFGLATPASKILLGELNPYLLAGLLYLGAAVGVMPLILRERTIRQLQRRVTARQYGYVAGAVVCGGLLGPVLLLLGLKAAHAASVAIWLNMELVATAVLGVLLFRDHLDRNGWLGVSLALGAGLIITGVEGEGGWLAALLVTAACFCWGFDNHFTALIDRFSPARITLFKGIFAGSVNIGLGLLLAGGLPGPTVIAKALILGAFSYGASIVLYVISAHHLGATRSQILFSSSPFFGVGLAALLLGEELRLPHLAAIGCLVGAIYFSSRVRHSHDHSHPEHSHTHLHRHDDGHHDHAHDENRNPSLPHSHAHHHPAVSHGHPHYPDLHHRHDHDA